MKGFEQGNRVEIINAWNAGAIGHIKYFTKSGDLAFVEFENGKRYFAQGNWWTNDWYPREQLVKLAEQTSPETSEPTEDNHQAFLHALFPAKYASFNDAMRAAGADGDE